MALGVERMIQIWELVITLIFRESLIVRLQSIRGCKTYSRELLRKEISTFSYQNDIQDGPTAEMGKEHFSKKYEREQNKEDITCVSKAAIFPAGLT